MVGPAIQQIPSQNNTDCRNQVGNLLFLEAVGTPLPGLCSQIFPFLAKNIVFGIVSMFFSQASGSLVFILLENASHKNSI
jgi:hypothetical protein